MKKCVVCGKQYENYICDYCANDDLIRLISKIINDYKLIKKDETLEFYHNEIEKNLLTDIIFELTEKLDSPFKEYYRTLSYFNKYYSVPKDKREWLIDNASICIESNLLNDEEKNKIKCSLMDAYYKNYDFEKAELISKELNYSNDYIILYMLSDFYIITRRYDIARILLNKALTLCDNDFKTTINNKIDDCENRRKGKENGGKAEYLPSLNLNKILYQNFMESIGIDIKIPKERAKAPEKISIEDYPKPLEKVEANFDSFVAFDVETTGIDHSKDSITELAAIRVKNGIIIESKEFIFQELVHPYKRKIPRNVEQLTGITNEMVEDAREIWEVFADFVEFLGDDILLGYNCMSFDSKFLVRAGRLSNIKIENKYFDVMKYAKKFKNELNLDKMTLTEVGRKLGIENPNAHRALADSITTAKVYLELLKKESEN